MKNLEKNETDTVSDVIKNAKNNETKMKEKKANDDAI